MGLFYRITLTGIARSEFVMFSNGSSVTSRVEAARRWRKKDLSDLAPDEIAVPVRVVNRLRIRSSIFESAGVPSALVVVSCVTTWRELLKQATRPPGVTISISRDFDIYPGGVWSSDDVTEDAP